MKVKSPEQLPLSHRIVMGSLKNEKSPISSFSTRYLGRWIILMFYIFFAVILYEAILGNDSTRTESSSFVEPNKTGKNVLLYAATQFFTEPITTERFLAHCPDVQKWCRISQEDGDADKADGIVFHNADYRAGEKVNKLVKNRKSDVPLVLWSLESPSNDMFRPANNIINWTMTYRTDADVWAPYGNLVKLEKAAEIGEELEELWKSKSKKATWLASNCITQNKRFDLIKKMTEKGFDIEIWGRCGKQPGACSGVSKQESDCVLDLLKPYKFYISIENSNCKDYVTEKFWKALGERKSIPIVLSRKYYEALGVPDSAYIAVDDFKNLDDFVAHVKKVEKDKDLYLKYHQWRREYRVFIGGGFSGWCNLCTKLRDVEVVRKNLKNYKDVAWWHSFETCDNTLADPFLT